MNMLFIDYVGLMLMNMLAGLVALAIFVLYDLEGPNGRRWVPPFLLTGGLALALGLHMVTHWPIIGSYNALFGELSVLFGAAFLGAALAVAKGWDLMPVTLYAFFGGALAVLGGVRIIDLHMTQMPTLSGAGFILTGAAGVFALPAWYLRRSRVVRGLGFLTLIAAAAIWALTGFMAFWFHLSGAKDWKPVVRIDLPNAPKK
jgi:putative membrane protein